jgi:beta-lactamase regulating signal transducer with metallopeptidase domain
MNDWFHSLPILSDPWLDGLWRASWQGGAGFLIVWLICTLAPRMPARFQCWLWRLALLKFVVVLLCKTPLAVPLLPAAAELPQPAPVSYAAVKVRDELPLIENGELSVATNDQPMSLGGVLVAAWLVGVAWQGCRLVRGWRAMRRFRRSCSTVTSEELVHELKTLCNRYGVRRPPALLECAGTGSPMLVGILRPAIILPSAMQSSFGPEHRRMAIAHELAHIKRHDLTWSLAAALVRMVFVFHPLVWWASRRLDIAQEIAADQWILTGSQKDLCSYAEMLVSVASQPRPCGLAPALSVGTAGGYRTLKRRIAAMKSFRPSSRGVVAASAILVGLIAILGIVPWQLVAAESLQNAEESQPAASWMENNPYQDLPAYAALADQNVRKALNLDGHQEEELRAIAVQFGALRTNQLASQNPTTDQVAEFKRKAKEFPKRIEQVLTPEQLAALKEIHIQMAAGQLVQYPAGAQAMGLDFSDKQKDELTRLGKEMNATVWQSRQDTREKMLAVLNPQQRKEFLAEVESVSVGPALFSGPNGRVSFAAYPDLWRPDIRGQLDLSPQQQAKLDAIVS